MSQISLHEKALLLSYLTVGYNLLEGVVSLLAGSLAGSIALVGFGLDSFVESLSGGIMIWRFRRHAHLTAAQEERREKLAIKLVGWTFFGLAAYVFYESLKKLAFQEAPAPSLLGIFIALASLILMPLLFALKLRTSAGLGSAGLGSASLRADARQNLACAFLSLSLLVGLGLNYVAGLWQADPIIGLIIGAVLVREGYSTLKEEKLCSCCGVSCDSQQEE
jgi:divalent metal cation (Fe/Co/Zn/Cd) transporter